VRTLRLFTVLIAVVLMVGEGYRSWGAGRPIATWMDDMVLGALMIGAAWALRVETPRRRALFTGVWGIAVGAVFVSLISKLLDPASIVAGNLQVSVLIGALAIIFASSVVAFAASLVIPFKQQA
jgi:peptidoglycan/LPS O-acetylase OafA/YrhL